MIELATKNPEVRLLAPLVERDAPFAVEWLKGDMGKQTLLLMGNVEANITIPSLEAEKERIQNFINAKDQLTWMISFREKTVGAVWVNLVASKYLEAPAIHIMIGDPDVRGRGVGEASMRAVIDYLRDTSDETFVYSRHLVSNPPAARLLTKVGFENLNSPYPDADGLMWQNVRLVLVTS